MFVIFGAAGPVGRASATALRRAGHPVRAVVRDRTQGAALAALGCDIAHADLNDAQALARAIDGAHAVQWLCPVPRAHDDPAAAMRATIDAGIAAFHKAPPPSLLALSDYGAEQPEGTGITTLFHYLETRLRGAASSLTFLRAAEHMHNWARVLPVALERGVLPSLHHPLDKLFPTVAARDVGELAAQLLLDGATQRPHATPRIVSVEAAQRVSALDVARTLQELSGRPVAAHAVPRNEWNAVLHGAGLGERHARLIVDLYDAHNAGRIDVEGVSERRFGATTLKDELAALLPRAAGVETRARSVE
ncbi:NmrA family NAD(P)-binding protein [Paraburkholderia sp. MMS20-SJTR3]|uniref:NmrA family NAD(P)-binding protein n=1 Tax=Paraburkholderia sejongensis TaxID=2886946 RepID=A0ABS8K5W4_9BURK|nr:NmrA family NAD(P)-binding protein [Paraburkholderia sp. MMS20-SJTR3]MCC8397559.1 NmrA family NAD(P)-binding protein [Paraburkholderia sp. MMS20-SJTR3]